MLAHVRFGLLISLALVAPSSIKASPMTFDFTGTFDQPVNGSDQFSGSFTIDSNATVTYLDVTPPYYPGSISEGGNDVSLTVTIGGITTHYNNAPGSDFPATLSVAQLSSNDPVDPSGDIVIVRGYQSDLDPGVNSGFALSFSSRTDVLFSQLGPNEVANLQNFDFSNPDSSSAGYSWVVNYADPLTASVDGTITSIVAVPAPEPSMLAVSGAMAIGAMACRRVSRR